MVIMLWFSVARTKHCGFSCLLATVLRQFWKKTNAVPYKLNVNTFVNCRKLPDSSPKNGPTWDQRSNQWNLTWKMMRARHKHVFQELQQQRTDVMSNQVTAINHNRTATQKKTTNEQNFGSRGCYASQSLTHCNEMTIIVGPITRLIKMFELNCVVSERFINLFYCCRWRVSAVPTDELSNMNVTNCERGWKSHYCTVWWTIKCSNWTFFSHDKLRFVGYVFGFGSIWSLIDWLIVLLCASRPTIGSAFDSSVRGDSVQ